MTEQEAIALGHKAENARDVLTLAFDAAEAGLIDKLKKTSPARVDDIRGLHACIQNIEAARSGVQQMIDNGLIATASQAD